MTNFFLQGDSLVADTSSLIYLAKSSIIRPFFQVFRVAVPPIVYEESIHQGYPGSDEIRVLRQEGRFSVHPVIEDDTVSRDLPRGGEREVIRLFYQLKPDGILIDDRQGVKACRNRGIPFVSALLIPSLLLVRDVISARQAEESLEIIVQVGRYSERVILFARRALSDASRRDRQTFIQKKRYA